MKAGMELTEIIIGCCFEVANELGIGFLESVYKNALIIVLKDAGLNVCIEKSLPVNFRKEKIGVFFADLVVEESVIVEVKCSKTLVAEHQAQLINYLKVSDIVDGLLVNFGTKHVEIKRVHHPEKFASREKAPLF